MKHLLSIKGGLGGAQAYANSEELISLLKKQAESNKLYGAICASPALALEPHGLLKVIFSNYCYYRLYNI
jgi:protein deglycase